MPRAAKQETATKASAGDMVSFASAGEWERWLEEHHDSTPDGVWLRLAKKGGAPSVSYDEAVDAALCFGWIDGQKKGLDATASLQRFTPRRARSVWSKRNTERVERLLKEGRMRPAGVREVEAAKADGRWQQAYSPPSEANMPEDFMSELQKNKKAFAFFQTLNKRNTYPVSYRLENAKTPETRAKRIKTFIEMFERGEKFYD